MNDKKIQTSHRFSQVLLKGIGLWREENTGTETSFIEQAIDEKLKRDLGSWRSRIKK